MRRRCDTNVVCWTGLIDALADLEQLRQAHSVAETALRKKHELTNSPHYGSVGKASQTMARPFRPHFEHGGANAQDSDQINSGTPAGGNGAMLQREVGRLGQRSALNISPRPDQLPVRRRLWRVAAQDGFGQGQRRRHDRHRTNGLGNHPVPHDLRPRHDLPQSV